MAIKGAEPEAGGERVVEPEPEPEAAGGGGEAGGGGAGGAGGAGGGGEAGVGGSGEGSAPYQRFGSYVRAQRQLARLTLRQLSDLARVSNPYLSQIERGLHQPSVAVIRSIADALNLSADALLAQAAGLSGEERHGRSTPDTEAAIRADNRLNEDQKAALLSVYRSMLAGR